MTGVASRAENGDQLAVARIVMDMCRVQMRVLSSALCAAMASKLE